MSSYTIIFTASTPLIQILIIFNKVEQKYFYELVLAYQ
jgi:hypothetical protein